MCIKDFFPNTSTRIYASSTKEHPKLKKSLWSLNSPNEFIFQTSDNDPNPEVVVDFAGPVLGNSVILFNRNSTKNVAERIRGLNLSISVDGNSWVPLDFKVSDDQIYLGKGMPILYDGMIRYLKISRNGRGAPIHLKNILIGKEVEILSVLSNNISQRFLEEYNIDVDGAELIRAATQNGKKIFEVRCGYDMVPHISSVKIKHLGRFSNSLIQVAHALFVASKINVSRVYIDYNERSRLLFNGSRKILVQGSTIEILIRSPNKRETLLEYDFFNVRQFKTLFSDFSNHYDILMRVRHGIIGYNSVEPFPDDEVLIHIRSGDIFSKDREVHRGYGQPPLAFYKLALSHAKPKHVHLVFEDRKNPVIGELEKYLTRLDIRFTCWSESLLEDIHIILKAKTIIAGFGTFIPGIVALSRNVKTIYGFNRKVDAFGRDDILHNVIVDVGGFYTSEVLNNNWVNSQQQRGLMITYPDHLLALDEKSEKMGIVMSYYDSIDFLRPKPSPFPLIRIGGDRDGAYLLPDDLQGIKACFSPGVSNRKDFEDDLLNRYGIASHMCDYSSDVDKFRTSLIRGQTFKKKWLDVNGRDDSISLENWVCELVPNSEDDLLLQMDIEGAEYRNLLKTPDAILRRFRIVVIELHGLGVCNRPYDFNKELGPLLVRLNKHFVCVHAHPNNCCGEFQLAGSKLNIPNVLELTLLRRDRWENFSEKDCYSPMLPHPLDIASNVTKNPPLSLNEYWLDSGERAPESTIKLLNDQVRYLSEALKQAQNISASQKQDVVIDLYLLAQNIASEQSAIISKPEASKLIELAQGKRFTLSSQHTACPSERQVRELRPFFFHTGEGRNQWITIDLEAEYRLFELRLINRTDSCRNRAYCLFYCIHNSHAPNLQQGLPVAVDEAFLTQADRICVTELRGCKGRYVTIFSPASTFLHLSAVRIFGLLGD